MSVANANFLGVDALRVDALKGMMWLHSYDLVPGTILYRFVDLKRRGAPWAAADGPWWLEYEALQQIKHFGERYGYGLGYSARIHAAILYEWSDITGVVRAEVTRPLTAWKGRGQQVESSAKDSRDLPRMTPMQSVNEVYQLYIPGVGGSSSLLSSVMRFIQYVQV
jgi:hypothetical protein